MRTLDIALRVNNNSNPMSTVDAQNNTRYIGLWGNIYPNLCYTDPTHPCQPSLSKGIYKVTGNFASLKWSKFPQTFHIYLLRLCSDLEIFLLAGGAPAGACRAYIA